MAMPAIINNQNCPSGMAAFFLDSVIALQLVIHWSSRVKWIKLYIVVLDKLKEI